MLLEGEAEALARKAIELALGGDASALRLCLGHLLPARRGRAIEFQLPAIERPDQVWDALSAIASAVAGGAITPQEGAEFGRLMEILLQAVSTGVLRWRPRPNPAEDRPLPPWETWADSRSS